MAAHRLPDSIVPMKAVSGTTLPADDGGWAFEIKWDGMRAIAFVEDGVLRLQSSNRIEMTNRFPELVGLPEDVAAKTAILDGEIVAFDDKGRPSFGRLQTRMHIGNRSEAARRAADTPVCLLLFDVLHVDGNDTTSLTYLERRRVLEALVDSGSNWRVPPNHVGDGDVLLDVAREQGLEGVMAKRIDSKYEIGRRSPAWRKVKVRLQQEFVIGGWHEGQGGRSGGLGAIHVGYYDGDALRYAGRVGTGFNAAELRRLGGLFDGLATDECPFDPPPPRLIARDAHWVRPVLVAQVAFAEWTEEGILRHPAYLGTREDKDPKDVVREPT